MENNETKSREYYTIDLAHIGKALWHRIWLIILAAILAGAAGFAYASFMIAPQYSSSILVYVNNRNVEGTTGSSVTTSDISASQSLVKTYGELLNNRTTLELVIAEAQVDHTYQQLSGMIASDASNGTQVMKVTVTGTDADEAAVIANAIATVLPARISEIIEGASMKVVEYAQPNYQKVSPSISKYTVIGVLLGAFLAAGVLALMAILDDTVHDEDYILQNYHYPILAKIPDLSRQTNGHNYYRNNPNKNNKAQ